MDHTCEICGTSQNLDRHHVIPKGMGGSKNPAVHDESNLITICRSCHRNIHEGRWNLVRSYEGIEVWDILTSKRIMRRLYSSNLDVPVLFQSLNLTEYCLSRLHWALPYLTDDQLLEAFAYALSFGKRAWLVQAAIIYEAQQRSVYGDRTLEAIARKFEISLRQAQKYALVWKVFFSHQAPEENVNVDAILLDEPSWYVVAASETADPVKWLAYAQDRKAENPGYSITLFRSEIRRARESGPFTKAPDCDIIHSGAAGLPRLEPAACPWIRPYCVLSGKAIPAGECDECEFETNKNCETNPNPSEG